MINSLCSVPTYMMSSLSQVSTCGKQEGIITSVILTVVCSIIFIISIFSIYTSQDYQKKNNPNYKKSSIPYIISVLIYILILLFLWLLNPKLAQMNKINDYHNDQIIVDNLMKTGMSKIDAQKQMIQQKQTEAANMARIEAATIEADALRNAFSKR